MPHGPCSQYYATLFTALAQLPQISPTQRPTAVKASTQSTLKGSNHPPSNPPPPLPPPLPPAVQMRLSLQSRLVLVDEVVVDDTLRLPRGHVGREEVELDELSPLTNSCSTEMEKGCSILADNEHKLLESMFGLSSIISRFKS